MNLISLYEAYGLAASLSLFVLLYIFIHYKYIRHHALHKKFLAALWELMKNTIHGEHIRTLGYREEQEKHNTKNDR